MSRISPFFKQCFVTAAVCWNSIGLGCALGFLTALIPELIKETSISRISITWIVISFVLAAPVGTLFTPSLMNQLGRKITLYIVGFILIAGWIVITISTTAEGLILGRILHGLGAGILTTLDSILIGEYTSPRNRGAFLSTISLAQAAGIFAVYLLRTWLSWQILILISVFFPFTGLFMTVYIPESPSWLLTKGKHDECRKVFKWLRGENENKELEDMIDSRTAFERAETQNLNSSYLPHIIKIICKKEFYKPILIVFHCTVLMRFAEMTVASNINTILNLLMGTNANIEFWILFLAAQRLVSNFMGIFIINYIKRRYMLIFSTGLCISSHIGLAMYAYIKYCGWIHENIWLSALLVNIQMFTIAIGIVPITNVISGEVFPLQYRSNCKAISLITGNVVIFVVMNLFPILMAYIELHGIYILFVAVLALNMAIIWMLLPETMRKTLQQIEDEFRGRPLQFEKIEATQSLELNPIETVSSTIPVEQKGNEGEAV